jgi:hypothetical protein
MKPGIAYWQSADASGKPRVDKDGNPVMAIPDLSRFAVSAPSASLIGVRDALAVATTDLPPPGRGSSARRDESCRRERESLESLHLLKRHAGNMHSGPLVHSDRLVSGTRPVGVSGIRQREERSLQPSKPRRWRPQSDQCSEPLRKARHSHPESRSSCVRSASPYPQGRLVRAVRLSREAAAPAPCSAALNCKCVMPITSSAH